MYIPYNLCKSSKKIEMKSTKQIYFDGHSWALVKETCIEVEKMKIEISIFHIYPCIIWGMKWGYGN